MIRGGHVNLIQFLPFLLKGLGGVIDGWRFLLVRACLDLGVGEPGFGSAVAGRYRCYVDDVENASSRVSEGNCCILRDIEDPEV